MTSHHKSHYFNSKQLMIKNVKDTNVENNRSCTQTDLYFAIFQDLILISLRKIYCISSTTLFQGNVVQHRGSCSASRKWIRTFFWVTPGQRYVCCFSPRASLGECVGKGVAPLCAIINFVQDSR